MSDDCLKRLESLLSESLESAKKRADTAFSSLIGGLLDTQIVLYGVGNFGKKLLASMLKNGFNVAALVDKNPDIQGTLINGVRVYSATEAAKLHGRDAICVVGVFSQGNGCSFKEICDMLGESGFANVVHGGIYAWGHGAGLLPNYCIDRPEVTLRHRDEIIAAFELLCDDESRKIFTEQLAIRTHMNLQEVGQPDGKGQYFTEEVVRRMPKSPVIVDCGAFNGDTIELFLHNVPGVALTKYYAFEPDAANLLDLRAYIDDLPPEIEDKIEVIPAAVGDKVCRVGFNSGHGSASSVGLAEDNAVDCLTVDSVIGGGRCDFIKMDIEGFESEALSGARETIAREKPILAISAYHKPNDFFKLILQIKKMNVDYRFYMRRHECDVWDTVIYAV